MLKQVIAKRGISVIMAGAMLGLGVPGVWAQQSCPTGSSMMQQMHQTGSGMSSMQGQTYTIPAGTSMTIRSTGMMPGNVGETYTGQIVNPVVVNGVTVIPAGSQVRGMVTAVNPTTNTMDIQFQEVATTTGENIPIRSSASVSRLQGQVVQQTQPMVSSTTGGTTLFPTVTWGPRALSPAGKVAAGTLGGALFGGATGTLAGLTMAATSSDIGISNGSAAVRGLAWGSAYGAGLGLLGGLVAAAADRERPAVTTVGYARPVTMGPTNITTGSVQEIPVGYQTPVTGVTTPVMTQVAFPTTDFVIILEQPATVTM